MAWARTRSFARGFIMNQLLSFSCACWRTTSSSFSPSFSLSLSSSTDLSSFQAHSRQSPSWFFCLSFLFFSMGSKACYKASLLFDGRHQSQEKIGINLALARAKRIYTFFCLISWTKNRVPKTLKDLVIWNMVSMEWAFLQRVSYLASMHKS